MAKKKDTLAAAEETKPEVIVNPSEPVNEIPPEAPKAGKNDVVVEYRDHAGRTTHRTFSKDVHGKDFEKLADEFVQTNARQGAKIV